MILIKLLLVHVIGDFVLQRKEWVAHKEQFKARSKWLYLHVAIHAALTLLFLAELSYWLIAVIILITHYFIDLAKLTFQNQSNRNQWFIGDQALHLLVIFGVYIAWEKPVIELSPYQESQIWVFATALIFITFASGIIIQVLLSNWSRKLAADHNESLGEAGKYIGILERLLVFVFIVTDHWEGVGFLIAAKSVFRFGDLKEAQDRKLTEYILIGTLLSFGIAIFTGILVKYW